jgi:hypothetical protein
VCVCVCVCLCVWLQFILFLVYAGRPLTVQDAIPELLQLVLDVFRTPALANSEMTVRLESGFMLGLRAVDLETREAFFALFDHDNAGQVWCLKTGAFPLVPLLLRLPCF